MILTLPPTRIGLEARREVARKGLREGMGGDLPHGRAPLDEAEYRVERTHLEEGESRIEGEGHRDLEEADKEPWKASAEIALQGGGNLSACRERQEEGREVHDPDQGKAQCRSLDCARGCYPWRCRTGSGRCSCNFSIHLGVAVIGSNPELRMVPPFESRFHDFDQGFTRAGRTGDRVNIQALRGENACYNGFGFLAYETAIVGLVVFSVSCQPLQILNSDRIHQTFTRRLWRGRVLPAQTGPPGHQRTTALP